MSWYSVREYARKMGLASSSVRRQVREGKLFAKKFGKNWFISVSPGTFNAPQEPEMQEPSQPFSSEAAILASSGGGNISEVVAFSSKALHHYLILSEKLISEKDLRLAEKEKQLQEQNQNVAELEAYVKLLEHEVARLKDKPEGWY